MIQLGKRMSSSIASIFRRHQSTPKRRVANIREVGFCLEPTRPVKSGRNLVTPFWLVPNRLIATRLMRRSALLWLSVRALCGFVFILGDRASSTWATSLGSFAVVPWVVCVSGFLTLVEVRRRNEDLFFANLGIHPLAIVCTVLITPVACECILTLSR